MSLRRVRKRDGREVAFDKDTIAAAVVRAQNAVGQHDPVFATEVADLVELALRRRYAWRGANSAGDAPQLFEDGAEEVTAVESVPGIEEIQDLVEVGLVELGRAAVAKAYILYRDRRSRARDSYAETAAQDGKLERPLSVQVREAEGTFPWSKARIVAALVHEADLSRTQAEEVAARVETRVISSGLKRLSTALIREFVDNELVSMGLSGALARQAPVSLPRHDLRELLESGAQSPVARRSRLGRPAGPGAREALGGDALRRFALADLFDEQTIERHLAGALHIEDLRAPHLYLTQAVACDLLQRGEPSASGAFDALDEIAKLTGAVSLGLVLEAPLSLLAPLTRVGRGERGASLANWLYSLTALARAAGRRIDLAGFGTKGLGLLAKLAGELDRLREGEIHPFLPRLFVDRKDLAALLDDERNLRPLLERLLEAGLLLPTWAPREERSLGPAGCRRAREHGGLSCGGAVSLNLARIGQHAGPWREDLALEAIAHLVEEAVSALASLAEFQRAARAARPGEARGRVSYALVPVGLREALRHLGDGEVRAEQGSRLLGLVADATRRYAAERGLSVALNAHYGEEARMRFALCDGAATRARQGLLFDAGDAQADAFLDETRPYGVGYDLGAAPGQRPGEAHAQLLATVSAGSWQALEFTRGKPAGPCPQLAAWECFEQQRSLRDSQPAQRRDADPAPLFSPTPSFTSEGPSTDTPSSVL